MWHGLSNNSNTNKTYYVEWLRCHTHKVDITFHNLNHSQCFQQNIVMAWIYSFTHRGIHRWHYNGVIMGAMASKITTRDSLLNRIFRRRSKKAWKHRVTGLCGGIHRWPVNSTHTWPVTRKMLPFDDVIMISVDDIIQWTLSREVICQLSSSPHSWQKSLLMVTHTLFFIYTLRLLLINVHDVRG